MRIRDWGQFYQKKGVGLKCRAKRCKLVRAKSIAKALYMWYISTSIWVLHIPNAGWNSHFQSRPAFRCKLKKTVFCKNLLQISSFFRVFAQKTLIMTLSTSVWSAQHPNAGQNIHQILLEMTKTYCRDLDLVSSPPKKELSKRIIKK